MQPLSPSPPSPTPLCLVSRLTCSPGAAAAATATCATYGSLNFFPDGTTNQPDAWTRTNQQAAGNTAASALFPIALYGNPWPKLYFLPAHPLLSTGQTAPPECRAPAGATRRLAAVDSSSSVIGAGTFTWMTALDGVASAAGTGAETLAAAAAEVPNWSMNVWGLADVSSRSLF